MSDSVLYVLASSDANAHVFAARQTLTRMARIHSGFANRTGKDHSIIDCPIWSSSFNGKPKATSFFSSCHRRLRLAVKRSGSDTY